MRKLIISIFQFIPYSITIYLLMLVIWGNYSPLKKNLIYLKGSYGFSNTRFQEIKKLKNIDLLFLGGSDCYRGFDNRIFIKHGLNSFNLGSTNQTPMQTEVLLKRYLDKINPELIVFAISPVTFSMDGVESSIDIISNDVNDFESFKMALKLNNIKVYNTLIYNLYNELRNKSFIEDSIKGLDSYIKGGFVEHTLTYYKNTNSIPIQLQLNIDQLNSFENIVGMIKKRNIKLILIQIPRTQSSYESYSNNASFDDMVCKYAPYYNFNKLIVLNDSLDFFDADHLNQNGVECFNESIITTLFGNK
jgi:hypothetical protein